ncbi:MAG: RIP metalloprotease RseP, partial [Verrucomicrobiales bacterium]
MPDFLLSIILIVAVVAIFNLIIFVHELGHFLAARWRGLQVDRFQIWFGKPLWKKTINGVQYGLGWLPAGGFVSLPQMAPMEMVEGERVDEGRDLPPIKPIDKIIVAFAGPLFSFLFAVVAALIVWGVGKPRDIIADTTLGYVEAGSPAEAAGLQVDDQILAIDGEPVEVFGGNLNGVMEKIMMSEDEQIRLQVKRGEEVLSVTTDYKSPEAGGLFKRKGLRSIGVWVRNEAKVGKLSPNGPAEKAGLQLGDVVTAINGQPVTSDRVIYQFLKDWEEKEVSLQVRRGEEELELTLVPQHPTNLQTGEKLTERPVMLGVYFETGEYDEQIYHPTAWEQIAESATMMWVTISKVASKGSDVGVEHLSGPVGIGNVMWQIIQTENGWKRLLFFMVLFNVNLAILNMLPLPVLDGGHILLSFLEMIAGRPVQ